jgi:hypothetical protein
VTDAAVVASARRGEGTREIGKIGGETVGVVV